MVSKENIDFRHAKFENQNPVAADKVAVMDRLTQENREFTDEVELSMSGIEGVIQWLYATYTN